MRKTPIQTRVGSYECIDRNMFVDRAATVGNVNLMESTQMARHADLVGVGFPAAFDWANVRLVCGVRNVVATKQRRISGD